MLCDFHIHSIYSKDSLQTVNCIFKTAKKKNIECISITDHETLKGSIVARKFLKGKILVIFGMEIKTEVGDVLCLFINEEIKSKKFFEVIDEVKNQDGIFILPHPYKRHKPEKIYKYFDLIESFNSRNNKENNLKATLLVKKFNLKSIAGSDAHFPWEIGKCLNYINAYEEEEIRKEIKRGNVKIVKNEYSFIAKPLSWVIDKVRKWM